MFPRSKFSLNLNADEYIPKKKKLNNNQEDIIGNEFREKLNLNLDTKSYQPKGGINNKQR